MAQSTSEYAAFYAEQVKGYDQLHPMKITLTSSSRASRPCVGSASYEGAISLASLNTASDIWALLPNGSVRLVNGTDETLSTLGTLFVVVFPIDTEATHVKTKVLETRAAAMGVRVSIMDATTHSLADSDADSDAGAGAGAGAGTF